MRLDGLVCISGGAVGADLNWAAVTKKHGGEAVHYSFDSHKTSAPEAELVRLPEEALRMGNADLKRTAKTLGRKFPPRDPNTLKLLQRNWWQIAQTRAVYAISELDLSRGLVQGGTGWAVHTYLNITLPQNQRCWVYDQKCELWFVYQNNAWASLKHSELPPKPTGRFTGIGSRALTQAGIAAITGVFEQ